MIFKSTAFKLGFEAGLNIRSCGLDVKTISKSYKNPYKKGTEDHSDFDHGKLEGYSKIPRESHFIQKPQEFGITCPKCKSENLDWSEWENHIWCNDCEYETSKYENPSSGPVPIQLAYELGMSLDKWDLINNKLLKFRISDSTYHSVDEVEIFGLRAKFVVESGNFFLKPIYSKLSKGEWWQNFSEILDDKNEKMVETFQDSMNTNTISLKSRIGKAILPKIDWFVQNNIKKEL